MFRGQDGEVAKPGMGVQASPKGMNKLGSGGAPWTVPISRQHLS